MEYRVADHTCGELYSHIQQSTWEKTKRCTNSLSWANLIRSWALMVWGLASWRGYFKNVEKNYSHFIQNGDVLFHLLNFFLCVMPTKRRIPSFQRQEYAISIHWHPISLIATIQSIKISTIHNKQFLIFLHSICVIRN